MVGFGSLAEAIESLIGDVVDQSHRPVGANLFLGSVIVDGAPFLVGLRLQFILDENNQLEEQEPVKFRVEDRGPREVTFQFEAEYLPWERAVDCLRSLTEPVWRGLTTGINQAPNHYFNAITDQYDDHMQWPGNRLDFRQTSTDELNNWDNWGPVVNLEVGTFQTLRHALQYYMWPGPTPSFFAVFMPFGEARLLSAEWQDDTVCVEVESAETSPPPTVHVTAHGLYDRPAFIASAKATQRLTEVAVPPTTSRIEVYLWGQNERLLGRLRLVSRGMSESSLRRSVKEQALEDFRAGENEQIEFKPFVGKGDTKESELVRTLVAFANSSGGRLYLGVNDDGVPIGESNLDKVDRNRSKPRREMAEKRMRALIRERINPVPVCAVTWIDVHGDPVLVVEVDKGSHRPYSSRSDNEVVIRSGSTNRRPDPHTELKALYGSQSRDHAVDSRWFE